MHKGFSNVLFYPKKLSKNSERVRKREKWGMTRHERGAYPGDR